MSYLIAIIVFGLLILVHELGHFIVAKLSGIRVLQFTIGFGPAILKKEIGGTVYALRLLPLGGAVMMQGEGDEDNEALLVGQTSAEAGAEQAQGGSFAEAGWLRRFLVCVAGPLMNFITGVLIVFLLMLPYNTHSEPVISGFLDGFPYAAADNGGVGFEVGDRIVRVDDFHIYTLSDFNLAMSYGQNNQYDITLKRDGKTVRLQDFEMKATVLDEDSGQYLYGFLLGQEEMGLLGKLSYAVRSAMTYLQSAVLGLKVMLTGRVSTSDMMGTVGIAGQMGALAKQSMNAMWSFVAYISINLAFVNLLPIPGLDGGKLLFLLIELVRGKKLDPKYEGVASMVGLGLMLLLFLFVTYHDILRLVS